MLCEDPKMKRQKSGFPNNWHTCVSLRLFYGATNILVLIGFKGENKHLLDCIFYQLQNASYFFSLIPVLYVEPPRNRLSLLLRRLFGMDGPASRNHKQPDENLCAFYVKTVDSSSTTIVFTFTLGKVDL